MGGLLYLGMRDSPKVVYYLWVRVDTTYLIGVIIPLGEGGTTSTYLGGRIKLMTHHRGI